MTTAREAVAWQDDHDCRLRRGSVICQECDLRTIAKYEGQVAPSVTPDAGAVEEAITKGKQEAWEDVFVAFGGYGRSSLAGLLAHNFVVKAVTLECRGRNGPVDQTVTANPEGVKKALDAIDEARRLRIEAYRSKQAIGRAGEKNGE